MVRKHLVSVATILIASLCGGGIVILSNSFQVYMKRFSGNGIITIKYLIPLLIIFITSLLVDIFFYQNKIDLLSPRVTFGFIYIISVIGQPLVKYIIDPSIGSIHLVESELSSFLFIATAAYLSFVVLSYMVDLIWFLIYKEKKATACINGVGSRIDYMWMQRITFIIMVISGVITSSSMINTLLRQFKYGIAYGQQQWSSGISYYLFISGLLIFMPAVVLNFYANSVIEKRLFNKKTVILISVFLILDFLTGDRGVASTVLFVILLSRHYFINKKLHFIRLSLSLIGIIYLFYLIFEWRNAKWNVYNLLLNVSSRPMKPLAVLLRDIGAPATIMTNVMRWFPNTQPFYYGMTYWHAFLSLVPGFFYGGRLERPFISPSIIYKLFFESSRFNPDAGYGFSLLAEGYINWGVIGGILSLGTTAIILQALYKNMKYNKQWFVKPLFVIVYACFPFALRSDAIALFKSIFYGVGLLVVINAFVKYHMYTYPQNSTSS